MAMHEYQRKLYLKIATVTAIIILPIIGFFGGVQYQKANTKTTAANVPSFAGGGQFPGTNNGQRPNIGTITAVTSTSITMTSQIDSTSKTFNITASTKVMDNQTETTASAIKTGDTVIVITDSSSNTDATQIVLNPSMPSGGGFPGQ